MNTTPPHNVYAAHGTDCYNHVQHSPMHWLILAPSVALLIAAAAADDSDLVVPFLVVSALTFTLSLAFRWLRVVDEGAHLAVRFGPLPLFRKTFSFTQITAAERDRTSFIDGWGIHWVPGRGWTYNLWGFDCVRLTLANRRTVRIGTDDPDALCRFLQQRLGGVNQITPPIGPVTET